MVYCHRCGTELDDSDSFCGDCGASADPEANTGTGARSVTRSDGGLNYFDQAVGQSAQAGYLGRQIDMAQRSMILAGLLGVFLPPLAYIYCNRWKWAIVNLFTVNYLMFGILLVPLHTADWIYTARRRLSKAGLTSEGSQKEMSEIDWLNDTAILGAALLVFVVVMFGIALALM